MTDAESAWFAGFFEGEGSFGSVRTLRQSLRLYISQKEREPLERCVEYAGGAIAGPNRQGMHRFYVGGHDRVLQIMDSILPWLSKRRQAQWAATIEGWTNRPLKGNFQANKTHCKHGHLYDTKNTRYQMVKNGKPWGRYCGECLRIRANRRYHRLRSEVDGGQRSGPG